MRKGEEEEWVRGGGDEEGRGDMTRFEGGGGGGARGERETNEGLRFAPPRILSHFKPRGSSGDISRGFIKK